MTTLVRPRPKLKPPGKQSINARRVAEKIIEGVGKGKVISVGKAMREVGYSDSVAENPKKVTEQLAYKEAMATYESKLVALRDKTLQALASKDLPNEKTYDLTGLLKVTDHSTALAQGKSTENIATKSQVIVFGSDDWLALQMEKKGVTDEKN